MSKLALTVIIAIVLLLPTSAARPAAVDPLLDNGNFEGGRHWETIYWTPEGGPFYDQYQEIAPPIGWTAWWLEGFLCSGTPDWRTGRPTVRVITTVPDPERIHGGQQATQWFTFWRCHDGGLLQRVQVEEEHYYTLRAYAHSWYSNCSTRPHDGPYNYDCQTPIDWAWDRLSVGIDPTGGIDPMGPAVVWGQAREVYGVYGQALMIDRVQAQAGMITVFLRSQANCPLKHADFYIDDAVLYDSTYRAFLPMMRR